MPQGSSSAEVCVVRNYETCAELSHEAESMSQKFLLSSALTESSFNSYAFFFHKLNKLIRSNIL